MKKETLKFCLILTIFITVSNLFPVTGSSPDSIQGNNMLKAGQYGMGLSSQVTGTSKLNLFGQPLIILDGMPYYTFSSDIINYATADLSDIANLLGISEEEIETVTILTDPTDLMSYGSAAKNGAIYITSKKASDTKLNINYSLKTRVSWEKPGYKMLSGDDYSMVMKQALYNPYNDEYASDIDEFNYDLTFIDYYNYNKNTDWFSAITQTGFQQEHALTLNGRRNGLGYRFSTMFNKGSGTIMNTGNTDYNFRLFLDYKIKDLLYISGGINYAHHYLTDYYKSNKAMDIRELALKMMPNMSVYEYTVDGQKTDDFFLPRPSLQGEDYPNPVAFANFASSSTELPRINPSIKLVLNPLQAVCYNLRIDFTHYNNLRTDFLPDLFHYLSNPELQGTTFNYEYTSKNFNLQNQISFNPYIGINHSVKLFGEYYFRHENLKYNDSAEGPFYKSHTNIPGKETNISNILAGISYKAYHKYEFKFSGLSEIKKYEEIEYDPALNYSSSVKWILSNEKYFLLKPVISTMAIKATLGKIHQQNSFYYTTTSYTNQTIEITRIDNTESFQYKHLDLFMSLFRDKADLKISYFKNSLNDQLILKNTMPYTSGIIDHPLMIYQSTDVKGWEIDLNAYLIQKQDFFIRFNIQLNTRQKSLSSLNYSSSPYISGPNGTYYSEIKLNQPFGEIKGYNYLGVYRYNNYITGSQENAPIARDEKGNVMTDSEGKPLPVILGPGSDSFYFQGGDAIYEDLNHDGYINEKDITVIGDARPILSGTAGPELKWKGLWLGTFFNFRVGNSVVNMARMELENMYSFDNQTVAVNDRWRKDGDIAEIPRALYQYGYNWLGSTRFVEDGSFLRLKALTLKYSVPEHICGKLHLKNLSLYITGKNLITWTKYSGADPDINLNTEWFDYGFDTNFSTPIKELVFGINVEL
ncbi:hypothetical protein [Saccharicrinis sp. FJH54]|uniref:hypothetical protein n=1 Tax=Saccharicrinis sp. FJH54 TaxID=3344665 RepID=UPI0035D4D874